MNNADMYDVAIVGAGCAGLAAARMLAKAGRRVVLLEARERVGGRTHSIKAQEGTWVDVGGQWLGPGQDRALALAQELKLSLWDQYHEGAHLLRMHGRTRRFSGNIPRVGLFSLIDLQFAVWRLEAMAKRIVADAPQQGPTAARQDAISVEAWMQRHVRSALTRSMMTSAIHAVLAAEPREISLLQFLGYLRSAGGLMPLISVEGGAQAWRIHGGAQQLSVGMAEQYRQHGGELRLEQPVAGMEQQAGHVDLRCAQGTVSAKLVIVAMSPADAGRISWTKPVPAARTQLMRRMPMGSVIKLIVLYERPFWREAGLSGEMVCDEEPLRMCFDALPADSEGGALVGFILGEQAVNWSGRPAERRRDAVLRQLAGYFGDDALHPREFIEKDWCADPWTGGCYGGLMAPGTMVRLGKLLREPEGRIHWAGTETATRWNGYIDGAIRSGERAAAEVLERLGG